MSVVIGSNKSRSAPEPRIVNVQLASEWQAAYGKSELITVNACALICVAWPNKSANTMGTEVSIVAFGTVIDFTPVRATSANKKTAAPHDDRSRRARFLFSSLQQICCCLCSRFRNREHQNGVQHNKVRIERKKNIVRAI